MTKRTTRTRAEAKRLMWEYYKKNKNYLPKEIRDRREQIISLLVTGSDVSRAFKCSRQYLRRPKAGYSPQQETASTG